MQVRDRIKGLKRVAASKLRPNPKNWRVHPDRQKDALRGVLAEVGIADAVIARDLGDGTYELIDGHLRAETLPDQKIPVLVVDVTEEEAAKLLASLDPLAAMAEADQAQLTALLAEIETESEALDAMLLSLGVENAKEDAKPRPKMAAEAEVEASDDDDKTGNLVTCPKCGHQWGIAGGPA